MKRDTGKMNTHDDWISFLLNESERAISLMQSAIDGLDEVRDCGRIQIIVEFADELRSHANTVSIHAKEIAQRANMKHEKSLKGGAK